MEGVQLVVFADYASPHCYLAESQLVTLRAGGVTVARRAFERYASPRPLADPRSPASQRVWEESVRPLAERLGAEIRFPPRPVRTRKAHEAAAFARAHDRFEDMHAALYRAYFVETRDIGRIDVLVEIGAALGLDAGALKVELDVDRWAEQVEAEEAEAAALGVGAVPAYRRRPTAAPGPDDVVVGVRDAAWLMRWLDGGTWTEDGQ